MLDGNTVVGCLWVGPHPSKRDAAWVYDIVFGFNERAIGLHRSLELAVVVEGVVDLRSAPERTDPGTCT